ncbi:hypothetical protein EVAR_7256_1 [Eumeta japonica]|uniref:Uncharacterized protein n=1 Tax=Eumeta variegata TaxID=151549 RepID=A0A4C1T2K9_EUMVA|nr:hypothetical protein EVAR_7256_1 [Eumeta japonica]
MLTGKKRMLNRGKKNVDLCNVPSVRRTWKHSSLSWFSFGFYRRSKREDLLLFMSVFSTSFGFVITRRLEFVQRLDDGDGRHRKSTTASLSSNSLKLGPYTLDQDEAACGVNDRRRYSDIRVRCGLKEDLVTRVEKGMLRWFGHLESANESTLTKQIYRANEHGRDDRTSLESVHARVKGGRVSPRRADDEGISRDFARNRRTDKQWTADDGGTARPPRRANPPHKMIRIRSPSRLRVNAVKTEPVSTLRPKSESRAEPGPELKAVP